MRSEKKEITSRRGKGRRRSTDLASGPTPASERAGGRSTEGVSEEGKTEPGEGGERGSSEVSRVCFDGVFAELQHFKEENGSLTISISHPSFLSILDLLSAVGMVELLKDRFHQQIDSLKDFSKEEERKDHSIADRASKNEEKSSGVSLTLDEKIRMKTEAKKVKSRSRRKRTTASSSLKILPSKESVAAELQKKNARGTAHRSAAAVHRSLILKEMFCPSDIIVTTKENNEGSDLTSASSSDDDSLGSLKTFHIAPTADDIGLESWNNLDATLSSGKPPAKAPQGNRRNSAGKYEKTIRKKMGKEHRSSSMPASWTNDAAKDNRESGKSTDGTLKKKPHRRCTFEDRLRRKANGESLEDIYEDWQSGEEARPIRHDSFALDDVVGSSSDWRSKMNACGRRSKDDIGLESWSNLDATLSSAKEPPAKVPQENRRNSASKYEKTIRKKMGKEHRSSSMPTSSTNDAAKDNNKGGKSTDGTLKKKPYRRCTFEDRLRRKANGESLEDIYEDWQSGEEARPIRHDSFALDDVVGSSTLSSRKELPTAKVPQESRRNSAGKHETTRKKMGKEHRSSSMPTSSTNDATKDNDEDGKSTDGTLEKKPHRRCTFEDRLRRKANGESLEDIYEDWQSGEEARPIRHDSFALDDVVGSSSDWRSKMNACGWQSKDDIGLESWSNLDETLSSGRELPPAKAPQENRRNSASKYEKTIRNKMGKEHRSSSMPTSSTNNATKGNIEGGKSTDGALKKKPHRRCTFEDRLRRKANGESLEDIYEDWQSGEEARPIQHDSFGSNLDATLSSGKIPPAKLSQGNRRNSASKYEKTIRTKMGKEHRSSSMPTSLPNDATKDDNECGKSTDGTLKKKPHRRCTFEDRLRRKVNGESLEEIYEDWQSGEEARPIRHDSFALDDVVGSSSDDDSLGSLDAFQNAPMVAGWRSKMNACGWQSKDDIGLESWSNLDATLAYSMKLSLGNHLTS